MPRYRITVEYDGSRFWGWQQQEGGPTVQGAIREALAQLTGEQVCVEGAGRTDRGVHATGQVAHFDLIKARDPHRLTTGLNHFLLREGASVRDVAMTDEQFHARFSALSRTYRYRILNRAEPSALDAARTWHVPVPLDTDLLQAGADLLIGHHDFSAFRASGCQSGSPFKTLDYFRWQRQGEELHAVIRSRSFLHNQVRIMVGTLYETGIGRKPLSWIDELLAGRDRCAAGRTAPACGLYLIDVGY